MTKKIIPSSPCGQKNIRDDRFDCKLSSISDILQSFFFFFFFLLLLLFFGGLICVHRLFLCFDTVHIWCDSFIGDFSPNCRLILTHRPILIGNISRQRIVAFVAQTECIVRVLGQNKFDSNIDSVKYAMILSIDKRKPDPMISDQVRHKPGSATTCGRFYKLCSENKGTYQMSTFLYFCPF